MENGDAYRECLMFVEQYRVTNYRNSAAASEGSQWNLARVADLNIENIPEGIDDDDDWDFDGAIVVETAQLVGMKRKQ